jgi:hypothetical protein
MPTKSPESKQHSKQTGKRKIKSATSQDRQKPGKEFGGPKGLEPTRYGDWERKGIVSDF